MRGGIVRVCAYAGEDHSRTRLRQLLRVFARSQVAPWIDHTGHVSLEGSSNDGFRVGIKTGCVYVAMTIDEQAVRPFATTVRFSRATARVAPTIQRLCLIVLHI